MTPHELVTGHTIYSCVVGSRVYGLAGPEALNDLVIRARVGD
jgi:hypothetical protein